MSIRGTDVPFQPGWRWTSGASRLGAAVCVLVLALTCAVVPAPAEPVSPATPMAPWPEPQPSLAEARARMTSLQVRAAATGERANEVVVQITAAVRQVRAISNAVARQAGDVERRRRAIGVVAVANYQTGGIDAATRLLFSPDPGQLLRQGATAQAVADQQLAALYELQNARAKLSDLQAGQRTELAGLQAMRAQLAAHKARLQADLASAGKIVARLTATQRQQLATQQAAEDRRSTANGLPSAASDGAAAAVRFAVSQLGDPYVWGADGPDSYDCSGLTLRAWAQAGVSLPHSSSAQYGAGRQVSRSELQPGDLLFYYSPISHVSMYLGDGKSVDAARPGTVVRIVPAFGRMPYVGAVRPG